LENNLQSPKTVALFATRDAILKFKHFSDYCDVAVPEEVTDTDRFQAFFTRLNKYLDDIEYATKNKHLGELRWKIDDIRKEALSIGMNFDIPVPECIANYGQLCRVPYKKYRYLKYFLGLIDEGVECIRSAEHPLSDEQKVTIARAIDSKILYEQIVNGQQCDDIRELSPEDHLDDLTPERDLSSIEEYLLELDRDIDGILGSDYDTDALTNLYDEIISKPGACSEKDIDKLIGYIQRCPHLTEGVITDECMDEFDKDYIREFEAFFELLIKYNKQK
jgi:hypothetical protein